MDEIRIISPKRPTPRLPPNCTLEVATDSFKYLGIHITSNQDLFHTLNLQAPLQRFHKDTKHWQSLPLSLLGKAALFKMMALPRFFNGLQNTPFPVPQTYFRAIEAEVTKLLWDNKPPRIAMTKLHQSWYDGGIALPNIQGYYWAAQLIVINQWLHVPHTDPAYSLDRLQLGLAGPHRALCNK